MVVKMEQTREFGRKKLNIPVEQQRKLSAAL